MFLLQFVMERTSIKNGAWQHNPYVGSDEANGYSRAAIALIGFLGMTREESIYFVARTDDEGHPLTGECTYRVEGSFAQNEARWWSITVYNTKNSKLIENEHDRYSFSGDTLPQHEDGSFAFRVSAAGNSGYWIPVQRDSDFDLTLRMYEPSPRAMHNPHEIRLPSITKEVCS
ncbi:MAG: DUF1214 domain-containing protein [Pseudomonadota bacterium]